VTEILLTFLALVFAAGAFALNEERRVSVKKTQNQRSPDGAALRRNPGNGPGK
jgi:hypothetical protein